MKTELIRGFSNLKAQGCVLTIGNFDGLHRGHQVLLECLKTSAATLHVPSMVMTFEPQPLEFFQHKLTPRLTRFREKFHLLAAAGVDRVLVVRFNAEFAKLSADDFITLLHQRLGMRHIIVGDDFRFGQGRQGDLPALIQAGEKMGFTVTAMPSFTLDGERVSSTRVRQALAVADHALAERLLGHPYFMMGKVVYGTQLGRQLGFPTANIHIQRRVTPVHGIYVVRVYGLTDQSLPGVANVGIRPTVGGTRILLEVYLFDFNQNIYGKEVKVEFCKKLRDEERFANLDLLKTQMQKDADQARAYFKARGELK